MRLRRSANRFRSGGGLSTAQIMNSYRQRARRRQRTEQELCAHGFKLSSHLSLTLGRMRSNWIEPLGSAQNQDHFYDQTSTVTPLTSPRADDGASAVDDGRFESAVVLGDLIAALGPLENHSALVTLIDLLQGGHVGRVPRPSTRTTTPKAPDRLGIRTVGIPTRNATRVALVVAAQSENSRLMEARRDVNRL